MKYRVYIKQARENLLETQSPKVEIVHGHLNSNGTEQPDTYDQLISGYIEIDQNKKYQLVELGQEYYVYDTYEYSDRGVIIADSAQEFTITPNNYFQYYKPKKPNAKYIRLIIRRNSRDGGLINKNEKDPGLYYARIKSFMFLESNKAIMIHDSQSPRQTDHLINPNLELSDSSPGSFTFTIYKGHPYSKNKINLWTDTIYVTRTYKNGSERIIWDGRPIHAEYDTSGNITYTCEGALGYFNDLRVLNTVGYDPKVSPEKFIQEYIIDYKNDSSRYDRMDRTFFSSSMLRNSYIDIDSGYKNVWAARRESALKWLNDIMDGYSGHMKVLYDKYSSPNDDHLTRSLVAIQDFDKNHIMQSVALVVYNSPQYVLKGTMLYDHNGHSGTLTIYKITRTIDVKKSGISRIIIRNNSEVVATIDNAVQKAKDEVDETIPGTNLKVKLSYDEEIVTNYHGINVYTPNGFEHFTRIHTEFGTEIFDAQKESSIGDVATKIIPRGAPCSQSINNGDGKNTDNDTEESNIFLNTSGAFVDGNYTGTISGTTIQGYRNFTWYDSKDHIEDPQLIKMYGLVEAVVDFESANTPLELYNAAKEWFKNLKKDIVKTSITISLNDFGQIEMTEDTSNYMLYTDPEYIDIWTQVYAKIPELDIGVNDPSEHYFVVSMSIPLDDHLNTKLTLANNRDLITDNKIVAGDIRGTPKGIIDKNSNATAP